MDANDVPGWEGTVGPFPGQYGKPHVYARDVHSGSGNCVCGATSGDRLHVQIAPGVDVPEIERRVRERAATELESRFQAMREDGDHDMRTVISVVRDVLRGQP